MCGIIAYMGHKNCVPILLDGLKALEYRGYDSAGISVLHVDSLHTIKSVGGLQNIEDRCEPSMLSYCGIGHTRWATHGKPSINNAHPHVTEDGRLAMVHNGIIENYNDIKNTLLSHYRFQSDTDSEVLLCLIHHIMLSKNIDAFEATKQALDQVIGAYAIVLLDRDHPDQLICARKGGSLIVGVGDNEYYISSDKIGIPTHIHNLIYMQDSTICYINNGINIYDMSRDIEIDYEIEKVYDNRLPVDKGGYEHFMLKEIYEQPGVVAQCISGRIHGNEIKLGGLIGYENYFDNANEITIVACGSSWHAALLGKYYIEQLSNKKVYVEYASEYRYRNSPILKNDIVIGISQSGETADTVAALQKAKDHGAIVVGICNVPNSSIARLTECGIFLRSGIEIGVASTKTFMAQILTLLMLGLWMAQRSTHKPSYQHIIRDILNLPHNITTVLNNASSIQQICIELHGMKNCLFLGRGFNFPIALEGALKLKEISYIHAEGYPAAEMKHGPIALIDHNMPVIVLANNEEQHNNKIYNNIKEIQARNGKVLLIYSDIWHDSDWSIKVPSSTDIISPLLSVVPLQLLAYYSAMQCDVNVDKPRNLAKSVTVE